MVLKQQYPSFSGIEFINNKDYVLSFLHKYITHNKFLTGFFDLKFSKNEIKINTAYTDLLHLNDPTSYNLDTYGITIKCKKDQEKFVFVPQEKRALYCFQNEKKPFEF